MAPTLHRDFGQRLLDSIDDFYAYGVHLLFNDWWEHAPAHAVQTYVQAIESHPEHGPLAREAWYADPVQVAGLLELAPGSLGLAWGRFMVENGLEERLAEGYRQLHEQFRNDGRLARMPAVLQYKVLRGYQTHDLHHVLTGAPATPLGELALQAFQLAQMNYPYAAMWIAVVTGHMALVDPLLTQPAMDAITEGWARGREARSIQFVKFEHRLTQDLEQLRREYRITPLDPAVCLTPTQRPPLLLSAA